MMIKKKYRILQVAVVTLILMCDIACTPASFTPPLTSKKRLDSLYRFFNRYSDMFDRMQKTAAFSRYAVQFSDDEKAAQLFMVNIDGSREFSKVHDYNNGLAPGAYIFFSFNLSPHPEEIIAFTNSVYEYYTASIPPLLAIDQEGGTVNRLRAVCSPLESPLKISSHCTEKEAYDVYANAAVQFRLLGFTFNLSPVTEPLLEINRDFLQERSFGSIENTIKYSKTMISAYNSQNILCSLKHFPGNTNDDPHTGLPIISINAQDFQQIMLYPFEQILSASSLHTSVLLSHAVIPSVAGNISACFSKELVTGILQDGMGFTGLILTDDIFMDAIVREGYDSFKASEKAILAGADMIMSTQKKFTHIVDYLVEKMAADAVLEQRINESFEKIIRMKIDTKILRYHKTSSYDIFSLLPQVNNYVLVHADSNFSPSHRERLFMEARKEGFELHSAYFSKELDTY